MNSEHIFIQNGESYVVQSGCMIWDEFLSQGDTLKIINAVEDACNKITVKLYWQRVIATLRITGKQLRKILEI